MRKLMHSFEVHSNESACRKSGRLGLDQVSGNFLSTIVSNILVCLTKLGEVDFHLFPTSWLTLMPQVGEVPTAPIRTGEGGSMTLTALQMLPGVVPSTPILITCSGVLLIYAPSDDVSVTTSFVAVIKSVCSNKIIVATPW